MLLVLTLFFFAYSQPSIFQNIQNLTQPTDGVEALSISDDNSILVAGCFDDLVYIYVQNGSEYSLQQTLANISSDVQAVDMTGDGRWLIVCGYDSDLYVYRNSNGFVLNQILSSVSGQIHAASITDDHQWIVFGDTDGNISVFKFNGAEFILNQTIVQGANPIYSLSLTNDGKRLAVSINGQYIFYYIHNGERFIRQLTFTYTTSAQRRVHLTDDYKHVTVADRDNKYVVVYEARGDSFEDIVTFSSSSTILSSSLHGEWLVITTATLAVLFYFDGTEFHQKQFLSYQEDFVWFHIFSKDKSMIILGIQNFVKIHKTQVILHVPLEKEKCKKNCELQRITKTIDIEESLPTIFWVVVIVIGSLILLTLVIGVVSLYFIFKSKPKKIMNKSTADKKGNKNKGKEKENEKKNPENPTMQTIKIERQQV